MSNVLKPLKMLSCCQKMLRSSPRPGAHPKSNRPVFTKQVHPSLRRPHTSQLSLPRTLFGESLAVSPPAGDSQRVPDAQPGPRCHSWVGARGNQKTLVLPKARAGGFMLELSNQNMWATLAAKGRGRGIRQVCLRAWLCLSCCTQAHA